jgi:UDP-N-acetyl-D-mannosaminuronate dehydrogenase
VCNVVTESVLIVGLGEIGRPIYEIMKRSRRFDVYGLDVDEARMRELGQSLEGLPAEVDVMHICIPCTSQDVFVKSVVTYAKKFRPKLLMVNSTVPPGTTFKIHESLGSLVAHTPVYGTHKSLEYMIWEMKRWTKIVGGVNAESAQKASSHLRKAGIKTSVLSGPLETELTKLLETIYTAWMIVFFQEAHRISKHFGASLQDIVSSIGEIHKVRLDRPVWFPGVIGGHCLAQNTELLLSVYDSEHLRLILASNESRKKEIGDKNVQNDVEKVRKVVQELQADLVKTRHLAVYKRSAPLGRGEILNH